MTEQSHKGIKIPSSTFFNLPEDKRQRFIELALEEFAANDYENASISRIVTRAEIAKGSLYQYFTDKKDLYFYLLSLASQKKGEFLSSTLSSNGDQPIFEQLDGLFLAMLQFQEQHPLLAQVGNRVMNANSPLSGDLISTARAATQKQFSSLFEQGKARGEIKADADTEAAGFIMTAVILEVGNQPSLGLDEFKKIYRQMLSILQDGLAVPGVERERKKNDE